MKSDNITNVERASNLILLSGGTEVHKIEKIIVRLTRQGVDLLKITEPTIMPALGNELSNDNETAFWKGARHPATIDLGCKFLPAG